MLAAGVGTSALVSGLLGEPLCGPVIATAGAYGLLGLAEDIRGVPVGIRLAAQVGAGVGFAAWLSTGRRVPFTARALAVGTMTAGWMVTYVNAFNFMDGIDGISIAQVLVAGGTWSVLGTVRRVPELVGLAAIATGAALGFAPFNLPSAKCFLGDVGSYGLGALLAGAAVAGLGAGLPPEAVLAPLAVYVTDTSLTLLRRVGRGEIWYRAHRSHVYQRLARGGWSHPSTSAYVGAVMAVVSALGMVSTGRSLKARVVADLVGVGVLAAYAMTPSVLSGRTEAE